MSIPVLSSVTTLLSGTVTEKLKELLKPFGMVVAGIFMALNLVLVFPTLMDQEVTAVLELEALPIAWQTVIGTLALFVLGYLISNFSSAFIGFLSGDSLRDWPGLSHLLAWWQRNRFRSLRRKVSSDYQTVQTWALHKLAYEFPSEESRLELTALGNALANVGSYTWNQYGVHLDTMWPVMTATLKTKDAELSTRLANSRTALEFLASLTWMVGLVAAELLFLPLFIGQPRWAWIGTAILLAASYVCYRACVRKATDWGCDVRAAFDQHRDEVATSLDMTELTGHSKKEQWEAASKWLLYGAVDFVGTPWEKDGRPVALTTWYEAPKTAEAQEPSVVAPATVTVQKHHRVLVEFAPEKTGETKRRVGGLEIDYVFIVTNEQSGEHAKTASGVSLLVSDPRLPIVPATVKGKLSRGPKQEEEISGQRQPGGPKARDALLWQLGDIPAGATVTLHCTVRYQQMVGLDRRAGVPRSITKVKLEDDMLLVYVKCPVPGPLDCCLVATGFKRYQLPEEARYSTKDQQGKPNRGTVTTDFPSAEEGAWKVGNVYDHELRFTIPLK